MFQFVVFVSGVFLLYAPIYCISLSPCLQRHISVPNLLTNLQTNHFLHLTTKRPFSSAQMCNEASLEGFLFFVVILSERLCSEEDISGDNDCCRRMVEVPSSPSPLLLTSSAVPCPSTSFAVLILSSLLTCPSPCPFSSYFTCPSSSYLVLLHRLLVLFIFPVLLFVFLHRFLILLLVLFFLNLPVFFSLSYNFSFLCSLSFFSLSYYFSLSFFSLSFSFVLLSFSFLFSPFFFFFSFLIVSCPSTCSFTCPSYFPNPFPCPSFYFLFSLYI